MMEFKRITQEDQGIFLNIEEFGRVYRLRIQNLEYLREGIVTSGIRSKTQREMQTGRGIHIAYEKLYIKTDSEISRLLHQGSLIYVNEYRYTVISIEEQEGITVIELEGRHQ